MIHYTLRFPRYRASTSHEPSCSYYIFSEHSLPYPFGILLFKGDILDSVSYYILTYILLMNENFVPEQNVTQKRRWFLPGILGWIGGSISTTIIIFTIYIFGDFSSLIALLPPKYPEYPSRPLSETRTVTPTPLTHNPILVPKSLAGEEYYLGINIVVTGINDITSLNNELLTPLLRNVETAYKEKRFVDVLSLVIEGRSLNEKQKEYLSTLSTGINKLRDGNNSVKDAIFSSLTKEFLNEATVLYDNALAYAGIVDVFLSGQVPSQETFLKFGDITKTITEHAPIFDAAAKNLLAYIAERLQII